MKRFCHRDNQALLAAVNTLNADFDPKTLPARALRAVTALVAAEITAFDEFSGDGRATGVAWHDPPAAFTAQQYEIFAEHVSEHPLFKPIIVEKRNSALKISDFASATEFAKTGIYNEFYRPVGVDKQLVVSLAFTEQQFVTCAFSRCGRDFGERDRLLLNALAPHLKAAFANAKIVERHQQREIQLLNLFNQTKQAILIVRANGTVQFATATAEELLCKYFAEFTGQQLLPGAIRAWLEQQVYTATKSNCTVAAPLRIQHGGDQLIVRCSLHPLPREATLFLEEICCPNAANFQVCGLTEREAEILCWISQGKSDGAIAVLCDISVRTVQKHVEHILCKLNAESRTAAVAIALDACSSLGSVRYTRRGGKVV